MRPRVLVRTFSVASGMLAQGHWKDQTGASGKHTANHQRLAINDSVHSLLQAARLYKRCTIQVYMSRDIMAHPILLALAYLSKCCTQVAAVLGFTILPP